MYYNQGRLNKESEKEQKEAYILPISDTVLRGRKVTTRQDISRANPKSPIVELNVQ